MTTRSFRTMLTATVILIGSLSMHHGQAAPISPETGNNSQPPWVLLAIVRTGGTYNTGSPGGISTAFYTKEACEASRAVLEQLATGLQTNVAEECVSTGASVSGSDVR